VGWKGELDQYAGLRGIRSYNSRDVQRGWIGQFWQRKWLTLKEAVVIKETDGSSTVTELRNV
jgi:hypothetical protein